MWRALVVCFLVAYSAAEQQQYEGAWRANTEYRYKVRTHTLAAIPKLQNQWVGVYTKADLTIRQLAKDKLIGKLYNGEYSEFHDSLANGPADYKPDNELQYQPQELNAKPFEIRLNNGIVHSIAVDKEMTNVELNRVKSILSQLQVDIQARNAINDERNHLPRNNDAHDQDQQAMYTVMEPTVTGKCETNYDITRVPMYLAQNYLEVDSRMPLRKGESVFEVIKSKNYSNCEQSMGYHFGISGLNEWKPNTNVMGSLSKSAVSRVIITGDFDKYLIRSSITTNRVVKTDADKENQQDSMVVSQVNVTLASMEESYGNLNVNTERLVDVGNLVYSYDLPSDAKNEFRPKSDSSESDDEDDATDSSENSMMKESPLFENEMRRQYNRPKQTRSPRSIHNNQEQSQWTQNELESNDYADDKKNNNGQRRFLNYLQPKPTLNNAPENPMHFYHIGNKGRSIHHSEDFNGSLATLKIVSEIVEDLQDPNEVPKKQTLRKFNILSRVIRTMNRQQIQETTDRIMNQNEQAQQNGNKARKVYTDALVSAGTGPAATEIMRLIEEQKIRGEAAAELIAQLPRNIRLPSEEMQKRFFEFVKHHAIKNQENVNTTAGLALADYLFKAQVSRKSNKNFYPVESYAQLTNYDSEFVAQEVIPYYSKQLEQAVSEKDAAKTLYAIRALGNLAHKSIPKAFEQYLSGKVQVTDFQRLTMVLALDKYATLYPEMAQSILYQLYQNKGETSEIRSAALFQWMRTNPSASYLQRVAEETNTEEDRNVRAAAKSAIESAARLRNPEQQQLARNAQAALNLLKPEQLGLQYSRTYLHDYVVREMDASYLKQCSYITEKSSYIPSGFISQTMSQIHGFKRMSEYQAVVSSVKQLVDSLSSKFKPTKSNEERRPSNEAEEEIYAEYSSGNPSKLTVEKIIKLLNNKSGQNKPLEGQLILDALYADRFIAFDEHTLKQWAQKWTNEANQLRNGRKINYTKLYNGAEAQISFPLESGLPFEYTYRQSSLVQVDGHILAKPLHNMNEDSNDYSDRIRVPEQIKLEAEFQAVYSTVHQRSMSFINPSNLQRYTSGYDKNTQIYVPLRIVSHIDIRNKEMKTEIKPLNENQQYKLLQIGSWPYTVRSDLLDLSPAPLSKYVKNINQRSLRQTNISFGKKETGFAFAFRGTHEKDSSQMMNIYNQLRKYDMTSLWMNNHQSTSPQHYSFEVILDGEKSSSKMAQFTLAYKNGKIQNAYEQNEQQKQEQEQEQKQWQREEQYKSHPRARGQSANGEEEHLAYSEFVQPNSQSRRAQLLRNAAKDMSAPTSTDVLDVAIEFVGDDKKHEYVATIAGATSQTEGKARILAFWQKAQANEEFKRLYLQLDAKLKTAAEHQQLNEAAYNDRPQADLKFKLSYDNGKDMEYSTVRGSVQLKQSHQLKEVIHHKRNHKNVELLKHIDHVDIELDWTDAPKDLLEQTISMKAADLYNYIRYATYQQLKEDKEYRGEENKLKLELRLRKDMSSVNITMKMANLKSEWNGVQMPKHMRSLIAVPTSQTNYNLIKEAARNAFEYEDTCHIKSNQIITFDNVKIEDADYDNTWHVAVQHMRQQSNEWNHQNEYQQEQAKKSNGYVAIAVRNIKNNQNENQEYPRKQRSQNIEVAMVLRQNANNEVQLNLRPGNEESNNLPRLTVNGKEHQLSESKVQNIYSNENQREWLARVYIVKQNTLDQSFVDVKVETTIGGYQVAYNGKEVQIYRDSLFRGNQGICGSYSGQRYNDLETPQHQLLRNKMEFVASWALIEDEQAHKALKQVQHKTRNANHPSEQILYINPVPSTKRAQKQQNEHDVDADKENNMAKNQQSQRNQQNQQSGTKHQTQYVEDQQKERICFSKRPLPVCAPGTKANGKYIQTVEAHCRDINDPAAKQYKSQIQRGRNVDMSAHKTNAELKFTVPKRCERN